MTFNTFDQSTCKMITRRLIMVVAVLAASAPFADSVLYRVNAQEWLRHGTPDGEIFTCKPCSEQVQIQISVGPEIPSDAPLTNNSEFIDSLSTDEAQAAFAESVMQGSVPGSFEIDIYRTGLSSLGGLDVLQFAATVEVGPLLSYDTTMVALHRYHIIKISLIM